MLYSAGLFFGLSAASHRLCNVCERLWEQSHAPNSCSRVELHSLPAACQTWLPCRPAVQAPVPTCAFYTRDQEMLKKSRKTRPCLQESQASCISQHILHQSGSACVILHLCDHVWSITLQLHSAPRPQNRVILKRARSQFPFWPGYTERHSTVTEAIYAIAKAYQGKGRFSGFSCLGLLQGVIGW